MKKLFTLAFLFSLLQSAYATHQSEGFLLRN